MVENAEAPDPFPYTPYPFRVGFLRCFPVLFPRVFRVHVAAFLVAERG